MALLSNRELMKYIESTLHRSRIIFEKHHSLTGAYDHLYYSLATLYDLLEEHQKEEDERLENFKPFVAKYCTNQNDTSDLKGSFWKTVDNGGAQPV